MKSDAIAGRHAGRHAASLALGFIMVFATTALARDKLPETTPEGLVLQH
ncbi:MAG: hypothetical protein PVF46_03020 [Lysobacterales bacterium]|jgi:hypothetical protein